jgi:ketosteroid isomerase-like protein
MTMTRTIAHDTEIRSVIEAQAKAIRDKNAKAAVSHYAPDSVTFDLAPPLRNPANGPALERSLDDWFATWQGPVGYETRDFSVTANDDLAFCHGFVRINGTKVNGERSDLWVRQTLCLKNIGGAWKIAHDHTSVPFHMDGSYKAAIDLKP